jgi:hypothetical protein
VELLVEEAGLEEDARNAIQIQRYALERCRSLGECRRAGTGCRSKRQEVISMALNLQIDESFGGATQPVPIKDETGAVSPISLTIGRVVIGKSDANAELAVGGNVYLEKTGNPRIDIQSHGFGTQHYSLRVTSNRDPAGGRKFIIRNDDHQRDDIVLDGAGNVTFAGDIILQNADCAEEFDVDDPRKLSPGTVVCIGPEARLHMSTEAYDRQVAGIVAGADDLRPGIVLGRGATGFPHVQIALLGRAWCKADASGEAIEVGDLLTTAATHGHAMKASDGQRSFGAVIGKALDGLTHDKGLIRVLVALQ